MKMNKNSALIIVDVQNDFLEKGALEVKNSNPIVPVINILQNKFSHIIATQDWHPANHKSFASQHKNKSIGEFIDLKGINQILWPDHCIQNTYGSEFSKDLNLEKVEKIVRKGSNPEIDSYSGFLENDKKTKTELDDYLKSQNIDTVYICGLASDYCVKFTTLDALNFGYKTYLIEDATKAVNLSPNDHEKAVEEMNQKGAKIIKSNALLN